jgi:hypothetical protein
VRGTRGVGGRHRPDSGVGDRRGCARCPARGGYLVGRENGAPAWLCAFHYEVWAALRKGPARQALGVAIWRLRRRAAGW